MRRTPARFLLLAGALALGVVTLALAEDGGRPLTTTLSGAAEVPGPGDTDGTGTFSARLNPGQEEICYTLTVESIATATAAHIHRGAEGESGPPVVTLEAPADGSTDTCVSARRDLVNEIIQDPAAFYVNVHNADFPSGAIRGQLGK